MRDRAVRRGVWAATAGVGALLLVLGILFWRTLPPIEGATVQPLRTARPFAAVPSLPSVLPEPVLQGVRAAVVVEPENVRRSPPGAYDTGNAYWRRVLTELGVELVPAERADVLVFSQAQCLGPVHRRLLAAHLARGGGVVSTGVLGAYDGLCAPLRDTLLAQLIGGEDGDIRPAPRRGTEAIYALVLGETVLGAGLPPGVRLEVQPSHDVVFRNATREMLYTTYERAPLTAGAEYFDAAAVRAMVGSGRIAAFGFSPVHLAGDWSRNAGQVVIANAVRWAAGHHTYQLAPWPVGRRAAAVLAHDVEADYHNARRAVEALAPYRLPGTAFIVGDLARADMETTRLLFANMEIGTHTQRHLPLDTLSPAAQASELAESKRVAEQMLGKPVVGLRPPGERYTLATLQSWADVGGQYVFANHEMRSAGPEVIPLLPDSLILLGRVSEDDFDMLDRDRVRDRGEMTTRLLTQLETCVATRGLCMFSYHSHMFSQRSLLPVVQALAARLKERRDVWTTTAGEVAAWWRGRAAVKLTPSEDGRSVVVRNVGPRPFTGGLLLVDAPHGTRRMVRLPVLQSGTEVRVE